MELRSFKKAGLLREQISKTAYLNQRKKLNPQAFLDLCQFHNRGLYDDGKMETYKGYLLLATDGSNVNVPTTAETIELYGTSSRKGTKPQASLGLSCMYDCINKTILTGSINRAKFHEAAEMEKHLEELPKLVGGLQSIIILDRGYPSMPLFLRLNEKKQKFVIRLRAIDFVQEQKAMKSQDEVITVAMTKSRLHNYKGTADYELMKAAGHLMLRIVKITLPCGTIECLATNLPYDEFDSEEISKLYTYRWSVETAFDTLKNKLALENFTGTRPMLIEQDIYASFYVCNLASDMIADAEYELAKQESERRTKRKYPMAINRSFAIGIMKDLLIASILEDSPKLKDALFRQMIDETLEEVLPVRTGRHFKRTKWLLAGKFSNSRKRAF